MTRLFLIFNAVVFGAFGLLMFFQPERAFDFLGVPSMSSDGIYEMRGIYGGVSIGAALLCLAGFLKTHMQLSALYFILAYAGGYALARVAALPLDGIPSTQFIVFSIFETVSALAALILIRRAPHT